MDPTPPTDLTIHVLVEIRDELRKTNQRVDVLTERVDAMGDRLDARIDSLGTRLDARIDAMGQQIVASEIRVATALVDVATAVDGVKTLLTDRLDLRDRVEQCERDISELKRASRGG